MSKFVYTPKQIEELQINLIALLYYIKNIDSNNLPICFHFCKIIINNIDICRQNNYQNIEELSILIQKDWKSAMEIHTGLMNYYIPNSVIVNQTISNQIKKIDNLISFDKY